MRKLYTITMALMCAAVCSAQTITIDGQAADWAEIPMLTEPGVSPMVKMVVPQEGITLPDGTAYALLVTGEHEKILAGYPVIYTDADNDKATGTNPWICPAMGYDYEMATWSAGTLFSQSETGNVREMAIMKSAFSEVAFSGTVSAWLTFNWGELYIPTDPGTEGWKWSAETYHPMYVAPYTYADLAGTHNAADAYTTHQALAKASSFNMKNAGSANDTLLWASWAVELTKQGEYTVSADISSTNGSSVDLQLVNPASNTVVASIRGNEIWQPAGNTEIGKLDLTGVPAGKYILKFSNHIEWSEMVLKSISLTYVDGGTETSLNQIQEAAPAKKILKDGQIQILHNGQTYNILGSRM